RRRMDRARPGNARNARTQARRRHGHRWAAGRRRHAGRGARRYRAAALAHAGLEPRLGVPARTARRSGNGHVRRRAPALRRLERAPARLSPGDPMRVDSAPRAMTALGFRVRASMFLRSFAVQGSWNYRTLIGAGFAFALLPALKALYGRDAGRLNDAMASHCRLFNKIGGASSSRREL